MAKQITRKATDKPEVLNVPRLSLMSAQSRAGRPKKVLMPAIPKELLEGMSELEQQWYDYFIQSLKEEYPDLTPFDLIQVYTLLAPCFISCMRLETRQMSSQELITMARQDPRTQFNQLMNSLSVRRRDRKGEKQEKDDGMEKFLMGLAK